MTSDFQTNIKQIEFTTNFQDCIATYNFENLFADQRTLVFSLTVLDTPSREYIKHFAKEYENLKQLGLDKIYTIGSDAFLGPWGNISSDTILSLPDKNLQFVTALANYTNSQSSLSDAARHWQYMIILNNGIPEKVWESPVKYKKNLPMDILKRKKYRFNGLNVDIVKKYLIDNLQ